MAKQIRVFLDNTPGRLEKVTGVLAEKGVSIREMLILDREKFGIVKFMVDKPEAALAALKEAGFATALKDITAVKLDDKVGKLHELIAFLSSNKINISDGYGVADQSVFCIETENLAQTEALLKSGGFKVLTDLEFYRG